jgi:acetyl/propionyl-CoA carboxylase alpha subunit
MSEQAKILAEMQGLIMNILKTGTASQEEGDRLDELEALMMDQKCYRPLQKAGCNYLGEEIANLFFDGFFV